MKVFLVSCPKLLFSIICRLKEEWDLALINVLTVSACNAAAVWLLAPCRSYGNTFRFDLQNTLQKLPNNTFEMSYPLREFDLQKRIHSLFYKAAELSILGTATGALQGSLSNYLAGKKKNRHIFCFYHGIITFTWAASLFFFQLMVDL